MPPTRKQPILQSRQEPYPTRSGPYYTRSSKTQMAPKLKLRIERSRSARSNSPDDIKDCAHGSPFANAPDNIKCPLCLMIQDITNVKQIVRIINQRGGIMKVQTERSNNRTNEMFYGNCCRRWRKTKISLLNHANCIEDLQVHTAGTELGEVCKSALELLEKNKDALFNVPGLPLKDSRAVPDTTNKLNKPLTRMEVDTISETPRKKKVRFEETVMIYPSVLLDAPPEAKEPTFGYHNPHTTRETSRLTQGDTFMRPYGARVSPTPGPWASPDGKAKVNTSKMRVSWEELEQDELDDDIEREFHASLDPAVVPPWLENEDLGLDSESDSDDDSDSDSSTSDTEVAHGDRVDDGSPSSSADPSGPNEQSPPRPSSVGTAERIPNPEDLFDPESWETINERITKGIDFLDAYGPWNDS